MKDKSYFIVFEGMDGCGKTSQMMMAANYVFGLKRFDPMLLTREPTFRAQGKKIWHLLRVDLDPMAKARKFLKLYFNDRKEHLKKDILPVLKNKNSVVLCDRYKYSTCAIQQAQGIPFREIEGMHKQLIVPGLVLIFDVPVETACARMKNDLKRKSAHKFEQKEIMKKIKVNYLALKKQLPSENIVVIDADRPKDEVFRVVRKEIDKLIGIER
ncbi:MAG: dTMP kinase [archaeon]